MGGRGGGALRAIHEDRESTKQPPELYKIWVLRRLGAAYLLFFKPNGAKRNINFVPFGRSNSGGGERGAARPAPASAPGAMRQGKRRGGPTRSRSSTAEREREAGAIDRSFPSSRAREGSFLILILGNSSYLYVSRETFKKSSIYQGFGWILFKLFLYSPGIDCKKKR